MQGIDGRGQELGHPTGDRGPVPVRIGSALAKQLQVDNYGELMDLAGLCDDWYGPISSA